MKRKGRVYLFCNFSKKRNVEFVMMLEVLLGSWTVHVLLAQDISHLHRLTWEKLTDISTNKIKP